MSHRHPSSLSSRFVNFVRCKKNVLRCSEIMAGHSKSFPSSPQSNPLLVFERTTPNRDGVSERPPSRNHPPCQQKGGQNIVDRMRVFFGGFHASANAPPPSKKAVVLFDSLRVLHILQQIRGLTIQQAADFVDVL